MTVNDASMSRKAAGDDDKGVLSLMKELFSFLPSILSHYILLQLALAVVVGYISKGTSNIFFFHQNAGKLRIISPIFEDHRDKM